MGVTRELVRFVADAKYENLSTAAIQATKAAVLNILGNCVAGNVTRIGRLHVELAKDMGGGRGQATIIGDGARVSIPAAAYANGNLAFALDYEDTLQYITHPGFITVSSGLAAGEHVGASGRDLILAIALGYEIVARIGVPTQPTPARGELVWGEQYHPFAGTVTAGKLLGLSEEQLDVAFGIAGTYATVPSAYKYFGMVAETRPLREVKLGWGFMCLGGTLAALSAHRGFRGGHGVLDGERGFYVMAGSDRCDFERMTRGLGERWMIVDTEFKIYPAIARNHPPYFATRALVDEHDIKPEDVKRVVVHGMQIPLVDDYNPQSAVDAQFSLPHAIAMAILREPLGPRMFSDERLFDPTVRAIFDVRIELNSGAWVTKAIEFPRDQPRRNRVHRPKGRKRMNNPHRSGKSRADIVRRTSENLPIDLTRRQLLQGGAGLAAVSLLGIPLQANATCAPAVWQLTAGQTIPVGTVTVRNDETNLYVK
jgi:2-methylcitrate dehydratase PrpD